MLAEETPTVTAASVPAVARAMVVREVPLRDFHLWEARRIDVLLWCQVSGMSTSAGEAGRALEGVGADGAVAARDGGGAVAG
ncbi:hypothetical protein GCM10010211_81750 [Streptomyces albospinus]|uniref:Uncharacterized protein n=1 Tax=Streptomyces albospinus TaxID=285515 RepID=A0ABQ2VNH5_9ACTN|nr:hypothetical protein GCM10010211_81750 [Streptomyces albospinus]